MSAAGSNFPGGDADLFLHDVDAGDRLGHRMLDLNRVFISMKKNAVFERNRRCRRHGSRWMVQAGNGRRCAK